MVAYIATQVLESSSLPTSLTAQITDTSPGISHYSKNYKIKTNTVSHSISQLSAQTPAIKREANYPLHKSDLSGTRTVNLKPNNPTHMMPVSSAAQSSSLPATIALSMFYRSTFSVLFFAALVLTMSTAEARWYKWVDESGNISYQDHPPPPTYDNSTQVLNTQGVTVKRIPSRKEQEQLDAEQEIQAAKNQRDEMLIKSFPAEEDLTRTRDKRLGHIDGTVTRMHDQLVILNSRLVLIEDKISNRINRGLTPSAALDSDRIAVLRSIDSTDALIKSKLKERRQVAAKFDADLVRYRELAMGIEKGAPDPQDEQSAALEE